MKDLPNESTISEKVFFTATVAIKFFPYSATMSPPQINKMASLTVLASIPVIAIKEIKPEYAKGINSQSLNSKGGLKEKQLHKIKCVHLIYPSARQVYFVHNLKHSPHYQVTRDILHLHLKCCSEHKIPVHEYEVNQSYMPDDDQLASDANIPFVLVANTGMKEFDKIQHLHKKLNLSHSYEPLDKIGVSNRGNVQHSWGSVVRIQNAIRSKVSLVGNHNAVKTFPKLKPNG